MNLESVPLLDGVVDVGAAEEREAAGEVEAEEADTDWWIA